MYGLMRVQGKQSSVKNRCALVLLYKKMFIVQHFFVLH